MGGQAVEVTFIVWILLIKWQLIYHTSASSSIVNSPGFPRLNGPTCSLSINRTRPSTCILYVEFDVLVRMEDEMIYIYKARVRLSP